MGSYLSFEGNGNYRPLLDSGLSHFSDDTKRYFFFVWYEPEAARFSAMQQLQVEYVLLDLPKPASMDSGNPAATLTGNS